ncbi:RelA/SpoT family protein [Patescibacteria group bacterium]|nr:RelA/SpoT family protein [Patescibacteria group bacterium]MBU0879553.1 RelA/SpoT family protein [Patescibacteria group bacterium]MBU0880447.1 RelA/SpoT family protein [Patescibacteria group bacterium]MBU0898169.1 RelA/SpoT family protein [Patescibacteria group bacterium]MBU1062649.1 RelA/SpoT family protein [Patescibacteria group bacterium]
MTINLIINKFKENNPNEDTSLLELAYEFAQKAHSNQLRKSGEQYIQHCLHTAFVLAQMKTDINTIIAGLLHDVPEDTKYTLEEIAKNFGEEVANLVEGVTKLSKIKYRGIERYRESLRKMFLAMARDLRVILIKFADRLHNLRTLDSLPPEKQIRIAKETMEIYAPIAGLLGIWRLKWQMEDICFKYLQPEEYKNLEYKYEVEKKIENNQYIQQIKNILGNKLKKEKMDFQITSRFKHLFSIYRKMQQKNYQFDEIYDVFALRVVVPTVADCYKVLGIIHSLWKPKTNRFKDYIAVPKPNGYRSLQTTVFGLDGKTTEFQIRTQEMDEEAKYGIASHWNYKTKNNNEENLKKQPRWIKEILKIQHETEDTHDFIKQIKFDIFRDRIFVFSPKGDAFDLPEGATPIDFAYAVHSDIGNQATGVRINDKIAPLSQVLKNGDLVEIIIEKKRKNPSRDWLKFVKTGKARNRIKQTLKGTLLDNFKKYIPGMQ